MRGPATAKLLIPRRRQLVNAYRVISTVRLFPVVTWPGGFVVLSCVAACMHVLSYVTSVRLSSWINKGNYYYYYYYYYHYITLELFRVA